MSGVFFLGFRLSWHKNKDVISPFGFSREIETMDFIAYSARLAPNAAKFSYFREVILPLVSPNVR